MVVVDNLTASGVNGRSFRVEDYDTSGEETKMRILKPNGAAGYSRISVRRAFGPHTSAINL